MWTMVKEGLDAALRKTARNKQSEVRFVVYNAVDQVMLDLFRKDIIIGQYLHAH